MSPLVPHTVKGESFARFHWKKNRLLYVLSHEIRLHIEGEKKEYQIADRLGWLHDLALLDGALIAATSSSGLETGKIVNIEEDRYGIAECPHGWISHITVYNGKLAYVESLDLGRVGHPTYRINYYSADSKSQKRPEFPCSIIALAVHDNKLVHVEDRDPIKTWEMKSRFVYTETGEVIISNVGWVNDVAVHEGDLIYAEKNGGIRYARNGKSAVERKGISAELINVLDGRLIYTSGYADEKGTQRSKLSYAESGEQILDVEGHIWALLPIDEETSDRLLNLPEVREIE
jgi:hypothetical protein